LLVASKVVKDEAIDDGCLADRLVSQEDDLALNGRVVLHLSNQYILFTMNKNSQHNHYTPPTPKKHLDNTSGLS
jgi:hypothetical protein